jgi:hypothetical protein
MSFLPWVLILVIKLHRDRKEYVQRERKENAKRAMERGEMISHLESNDLWNKS